MLPTENVDITELRRNLVQKRGDLISVRDIKSDGDESPALLDACCLVCGSTLLCYVSEGIHPTCSENDIRTTLFNVFEALSATDQR